MRSLVLGAEAVEDPPGDEVAHDVDGDQGEDAACDLRSLGELTEGVAGIDGVVQAGVSVGFRMLDVVLKLVVHKSLVAPLEDGQVLELLKVPLNVSRGHEEASEEHEGNDQHGGQGHSQLLVGEGGRDDERVATGSVVDQDQDEQEDEELVSSGVQANQVVDNDTEDGGGGDRE